MFYGIALPGLLLAALGQALVLWVARVRTRESRPTWPALAGRLVAADALVVAALLVLQVISRHVNHGPHDRRVVVIGVHLCLAFLLSSTLWSLLLHGPLGRRAWWAGIALAAATAAGLILPGLNTSWSGRPAQVTHYRLLLPHLPKSLDGAQVVVVGDVHVGRGLTLKEARARLAPLRALHPDLVVFVGDITCNTTSAVAHGEALLDELAPRAPRVAVLGNHDRRVAPHTTMTGWPKHGFVPLRDAGQLLEVRGTQIWVGGTDNPAHGPVTVGRALRGAPLDRFALLLSHSPDVITDPKSVRADLILSGHTHGGQVNLPLVGPLACSTDLGPRVASGIIPAGPTTLFVTRGVGNGGLPFRIFSPPEIAVLELHAR